LTNDSGEHRAERNDLDFIRNVQIFSPVAAPFIPLSRSYLTLRSTFGIPQIMHDRRDSISAHANPTEGLTRVLIEEAKNIPAWNLHSEC